MKKILAISLLAFATLSLPANAGLAGKGGVKDIYKNGLIRGNPSYKIVCQRGSRVVVRKASYWTDSLGYGFSITFSDMTLQQFARDLCYG